MRDVTWSAGIVNELRRRPCQQRVRAQLHAEHQVLHVQLVLEPFILFAQIVCTYNHFLQRDLTVRLQHTHPFGHLLC